VFFLHRRPLQMLRWTKVLDYLTAHLICFACLWFPWLVSCVWLSLSDWPTTMWYLFPEGRKVKEYRACNKANGHYSCTLDKKHNISNYDKVRLKSRVVSLLLSIDLKILELGNLRECESFGNLKEFDCIVFNTRTAPYRSYQWQDKIVEGGQAAYCTSYNQKRLQTFFLWRQNNAFSRKYSSMFESLHVQRARFTLYERTKRLTC